MESSAIGVQKKTGQEVGALANVKRILVSHSTKIFSMELPNKLLYSLIHKDHGIACHVSFSMTT